MAGMDDITRKARELLGNGKVQDALKSEKAEGISDSLLDQVARGAKKVSGGKHNEKIDDARRAADKRIGDQ